MGFVIGSVSTIAHCVLLSLVYFAATAAAAAATNNNPSDLETITYTLDCSCDLCRPRLSYDSRFIPVFKGPKRTVLMSFENIDNIYDSLRPKVHIVCILDP